MNLFQEATVSHSNGRFVIKCPFDWNSQLKADGWNWDGRHKEWITTAPEVAKKYQSYADPETQEVITAGVKFMNDSYRLSKALDANFEVAHKKLQPFPYQRAGVAYIVSRKNTLLGDVPGLGKEQAHWEPILTPSGFVPLSQIKVGDKVIGSSGKPITVTGVFPQGIKPIYEIGFRDGSSCTSGLDHLWLVMGQNRLRDGWMVKTLRQILDYGIVKANGKNKWHTPLVGPVEFEAKEYHIHPYVLGTLIGDGATSASPPVLSNPDFDSEVIDRVRTLLPDYITVRRDTTGACDRYAFADHDIHKGNRMTDEIRRLGLNVKSGDKFIPTEYLLGSADQRREMLKGLMDTDGSASKNRVAFHTISTRLANDVKWLVASLGGVAIIRPYDRSHEGKPLEYQVNVKMNECPFHLKRKAEQWWPAVRNKPSRLMQSATYIGDHEAICIKVDAEDSLYVCNDFIVTHNTSQAILSINHIRPATVLIVCPKSLKINWMRELDMWMTLVRNVDILKGEWRPFTEIGIIHYDILHKMKDTIDSMEFDMLIVDEAHHCKTPTTRKSKMVMAIKAKRKIYMTGTPVVNRPKELWPLIHSLDPDRWQTFTHFAERYCKDEADEGYRPTRGKKFGQYNGAANLDELQKILRGTIMVRRSKEEVLPQLPGKMRQVVELEADANVQRAISDGVKEYKELENRVEKLSDVVQKLKRGGDEESYKQAVESLKEANLEKFSVLARQRVESARMKLPYVLQYLEELLEDSDEKYIVFGHHKEMLGALNEKFADCSVRIDGSVTSEQRRQDAVDQFQNDPNIRFFFGQFTAAGVGITLTASSNVIFVEMDWVPGNISQCEDRSCRIGQKNTVHVMHIVLEGSIDSYIMKKVIEKQDVIERTVDHQRL